MSFWLTGHHLSSKRPELFFSLELIPLSLPPSPTPLQCAIVLAVSWSGWWQEASQLLGIPALLFPDIPTHPDSGRATASWDAGGLQLGWNNCREWLHLNGIGARAATLTLPGGSWSLFLPLVSSAVPAHQVSSADGPQILIDCAPAVQNDTTLCTTSSFFSSALSIMSKVLSYKVIVINLITHTTDRLSTYCW